MANIHYTIRMVCDTYWSQLFNDSNTSQKKNIIQYDIRILLCATDPSLGCYFHPYKNTEIEPKLKTTLQEAPPRGPEISQFLYLWYRIHTLLKRSMAPS